MPLGERHSKLASSEVRTEASMHAASERDVTIHFAVEANVKPVGELGGIDVGGAVADADCGAFRTPYFHTFFRMDDGSTLAFFESPGLPPTPAVPTPAFNNFNHIALQVPSRADADHWREWLEQNGVEVRPVDHHIIYSLYFQDPNGVRLEITATLDETWNEQPEAADTLLSGWAATKASARLAGEDVDEQLRLFIARHAHQASIYGERSGEHADA